MARTYPFDNFPERYDAWFDRNEILYGLELKALRMLVPAGGQSLEIGVGSGKFAAPLGIRFGVEPSVTMAERAKRAGIRVILGIAEALPVKTASMDTALMVTTICFVDDITASFQETKRVLKPGGVITIGFVDRESHLGRKYFRRKDRSIFYRSATFYSCSEVLDLLARTGFRDLKTLQTILPENKGCSRVEKGCGRGGFIVIKARKPVSAHE